MNGKKSKGAKGNSKREVLVVGSKMKAFVKSKGMKSSGDLIDALNASMYCALERACERASSNKRSTVRPQDI